MMATVPQVTSGLGLRKFQADGFLLTRVYIACLVALREVEQWGHLPVAWSASATHCMKENKEN